MLNFSAFIGYIGSKEPETIINSTLQQRQWMKVIEREICAIEHRQRVVLAIDERMIDGAKIQRS